MKTLSHQSTLLVSGGYSNQQQVLLLRLNVVLPVSTLSAVSSLAGASSADVAAFAAALTASGADLSTVTYTLEYGYYNDSYSSQTA